jgi:hypothetical protein
MLEQVLMNCGDFHPGTRLASFVMLIKDISTGVLEEIVLVRRY